jgi:hypothetical protein
MKYFMIFIESFVTALPVTILFALVVIGLGLIYDKMARLEREAWFKGQRNSQHKAQHKQAKTDHSRAA